MSLLLHRPVAGTAPAVGSGEQEATAEPAVYDLELIAPIASGTGSPAMHTGHRFYKAYPGIPYNIRAIVVGGSYPYTFALSNAPTGMTINADTGEINWPAPEVGQSGAEPTLTVTDSLDEEVQGTWAITVSTSGFKFIDQAASSSGVGTIADPMKTLEDVRNSGNAVFPDILYFRAGTYTLTDTTLTGGGYFEFEYNGFSGNGRPMTWLTYPGETVTIDFQRGVDNDGHDAPYIKLVGPNTYVDGFTLTNDRTKSFELGATGFRAAVVRNITATDGGPGEDGSNAAYFMMTAGGGGDCSYGLAIQDCDFGSAGHNAVKSYSMEKSVIEDCIFTQNDGIEQKDGVPQYTIRNNVFDECTIGVGGNMNTRGGVDVTYGEINYNLFIDPSTSAIEIGRAKISTIGRTDVYRNTIMGVVKVQNVVTADGPYNFFHNVKINTDGAQTPWAYIQDTAITDSSRLTLTEELNGVTADNIVDANGDLQGSYSSDHGPTTEEPRGHALP